ncbi:LysR family transcriptional regulator [Isoalcanivorax indicus]|uniref:LysR family transcriptional regulator n=1 Tax=Isoalcanivorax indicus TaxID=2202653 RepID=UPI0013C5024F|nr:LysR family transcriptional regulator [Isoalcanivorax indicus]
MNRITDLDIFVAVIKAGTIAGAARHIGMAPASVKKRLHRLETDIGTQLVYRRTRSNRMTESGCRLYNRLETIFSDLDDAVQTVHRYGHTPMGSLKVIISTALKGGIFEPIVADYTYMFPKVTLEMQFSDRHVDFVRDGCDVAVVLNRPSDSNLMARKVFENPAFVCATPEYLKGKPPIETPADLRKHLCMALDCEGGFKETWPFKTRTRPRTTHVRATLFTNSTAVLYNWVTTHQGIAVLNNDAVPHDIASGKLVHLLPEYTLPNLDYYMVFGNKRSLPARTLEFVRFAESRLLGTEYIPPKVDGEEVVVPPADGGGTRKMEPFTNLARAEVD